MDTAFSIRLRSFGFLHPGRERMLTRVLKRAWPFVPGSTLHGAVAAALIRLDGIDPDRPWEAAGGFHDLLRLVRDGNVRFTPQLPAENPLTTAQSYCQATVSGYPRRLFQTTPHAPHNRNTEQIHGDQVYAVSAHRPYVDYHGFVFGTAAVGPLLRRAFRLFPLIPFGGKGKYSMVQAEVLAQQPIRGFESDMRRWLEQRDGEGGWVELLTPMLLQSGEQDWLLMHSDRSLVRRLQRYRIWQSGTVYDDSQEDRVARRGDHVFPENEDLQKYPGGTESRAVTGMPEGSRFYLGEKETLMENVPALFIRGVGHPGWTYLGWGQVVIV